MADARHNEISFPLPPGWVDMSQIVAVGPADNDFRPNLVITREPVTPMETAIAFAQRQLPLLKQSIPSLQVIKESPTKLGALSAFSREYTGVYQGRKLQQLQLYVVQNGTAYVFTVTHVEGKLDAVRPTVEKMLAGLTIG
jgi:hypothetical protein